MRRILSSLLLVTCLIATWLPITPASADGARQRLATVTPTPSPTPGKQEDVRGILDKMSVADKVGQLFVVTFQGNNVASDSDIATLVRDYRVGGVVLMPANGNFRNVPAESQIPAAGADAQKVTLSTPQQIALLTDQLQGLAISPARPVTTTIAAATTVTTAPPAKKTTPAPKPTATQTASAAKAPVSDAGIPLLIGLEWSGDESSVFSGSGGFTPLPSAGVQVAPMAMALGRGVKPPLPEKTELSSPLHSRPISRGMPAFETGALAAEAVCVAVGFGAGVVFFAGGAVVTVVAAAIVVVTGRAGLMASPCNWSVRSAICCGVLSVTFWASAPAAGIWDSAGTLRKLPLVGMSTTPPTR